MLTKEKPSILFNMSSVYDTWATTHPRTILSANWYGFCKILQFPS